MADGLDVIIVDDDPGVCEIVSKIITGFYAWGEVFSFTDAIEEGFPSAHEDAIMITGFASDDVVNTCVASGINHLLEKPVKAYALQFGIRAVAEKYLKFARKLMKNSEFADIVADL